MLGSAILAALTVSIILGAAYDMISLLNQEHEISGIMNSSNEIVVNLCKAGMRFMVQHQQSTNIVDACCSFCGKQHYQVERLTAGPSGVYICNECVDLCQKILEERGTIDLFGTESPFFLPCLSCGARCRRTDHYCFHCGQKRKQSALDGNTV